jgi:outer membrane protein
MLCFTSTRAVAESGALRGLGEPAAPESMASPDKLFPQSTTNGSTSNSGSTSSRSTSSVSRSSGSTTTGSTSNGNSTLAPITKDGTAGSGSAGVAPVLLKQNISRIDLGKPLTLNGAVQFADGNYQSILKGQSQVKAAKENVTVQKLNEYLPDSLLQYQELLASHNKLSQVFFGSPVFPAMAGPGLDNTTMRPYFFSGAGVSVDWAPIDFGLHKARIDLSKLQYQQASASYATTKLDVEISTASSFLDVIEAAEQVRAMEENVTSFQKFSEVVHAQVNAFLKPGADASLADAQWANARNQLLRARLSYDLAIANLANSIGVGGQEVTVETKGIAASDQPAELQRGTPVFEDVPILKASHVVLLSAVQQRKILDKEYWPVFHFLGGANLRSSGLALNGRDSQSANVSGVIPVVPNYQVAMIINWNFLDYFRLKAEKKVQNERIIQQKYDYDLVLQNLRAEDVRSRARVKTAISLAANMPVQVEASMQAARQAEARYQTGLGAVAQVAEANQVLAQSRMQEAVARVGVWRALLSVSAVHGDLRPFLAEADRIQRGL